MRRPARSDRLRRTRENGYILPLVDVLDENIVRVTLEKQVFTGSSNSSGKKMMLRR